MAESDILRVIYAIVNDWMDENKREERNLFLPDTKQERAVGVVRAIYSLFKPFKNDESEMEDVANGTN